MITWCWHYIWTAPRYCQRLFGSRSMPHLYSALSLSSSWLYLWLAILCNLKFSDCSPFPPVSKFAVLLLVDLWDSQWFISLFWKVRQVGYSPVSALGIKNLFLLAGKRCISFSFFIILANRALRCLFIFSLFHQKLWIWSFPADFQLSVFTIALARCFGVFSNAW